MNLYPEFKNKKIILTGVASGIGNAQARAFLDAGAIIFGADVQQNEAVEKLAQEANFHFAKVDVRSLQEITDWIKPILAKNQIDILVNTAGILDGFAPTLETSEEQWDNIFKSSVEDSSKEMHGGDICRSYSVNGYICPIKVFTSMSGNIDSGLLNRYLDSLPKHENEAEPRYNMFTWRNNNGLFTTAYFPRAEHRPSCYYAEGNAQILVSPGALDMGGLIVTPREEDFNKIDEETVRKIFNEVSF